MIKEKDFNQYVGRMFRCSHSKSLFKSSNLSSEDFVSALAKKEIAVILDVQKNKDWVFARVLNSETSKTGWLVLDVDRFLNFVKNV